jgi:hypothetical protein
MLRKQDVLAGKFYVNRERRIAREVLRTNQHTVLFNTYHLNTGNSCGCPSECLVEDFVRWADREVSPAELAFLQYQSMDADYSPSVR